MTRADTTGARQVISHAHARDLAQCWQDTERPGHPVTRLARSGEITPDAEISLEHDLGLLEDAASSWGSPRSIPEKQLRDLLDYVRYHGPRPAVREWQDLRDAEFVRSIRRMASEVRSRRPTVYEPPEGGRAREDNRAPDGGRAPEGPLPRPALPRPPDAWPPPEDPRGR